MTEKAPGDPALAQSAVPAVDRCRARGRLAQLEPSRSGRVGLRMIRQSHVKRRADPALGMDMIGVVPRFAKPNRPAARESNPSVARLAQQRVLGIVWRQLRAILRYRLDDGRAQCLDFRFKPAQQWAIGLRPAAHRLVEIAALRNMKRAQHVGERVERRQAIGKIENRNERVPGVEPIRSRVADQTPSDRSIWPELLGPRSVKLAVDEGDRLSGLAGPDQVTDMPNAQSSRGRPAPSFRTAGRPGRPG